MFGSFGRGLECSFIRAYVGYIVIVFIFADSPIVWYISTGIVRVLSIDAGEVSKHSKFEVRNAREFD